MFDTKRLIVSFGSTDYPILVGLKSKANLDDIYHQVSSMEFIARASLRIEAKGTWLPVNTTGLVRCFNANESAEAVKAIVSVPYYNKSIKCMVMGMNTL